MTEVTNLADFKKKKAVTDDLTRGGRTPLYVSHLTGKVTGGPESRESNVDFGERLQRIRASLDKINRVMSELKRMNADGDMDKRS